MKMNTEKDKKIRGVVLTLLGGILWGVCGSCGQFLFQFKEVNSDWLVPIRLTGAGLLILIVLWIKERKKIFEVWKNPAGRRDILIFSLFGMMLCQYAYFTTIQYSNAGTATVLQYTGPAMILVWICLRMRRKPKLYEIIALLCSMAGTFIWQLMEIYHSWQFRQKHCSGDFWQQWLWWFIRFSRLNL